MSAAAGTVRRRAAFKLTRPNIREHPLQKQIVRTLMLEIAPPGRVSPHGVVWWCIDIEDYGIPGTRVERGCVAGVMDCFILYHGIAHLPEFKADDGVLSAAQKSLASAVIAAGGRVAVMRDAADLLPTLDAWRIPRNNRVRL